MLRSLQSRAMSLRSQPNNFSMRQQYGGETTRARAGSSFSNDCEPRSDGDGCVASWMLVCHRPVVLNRGGGYLWLRHSGVGRNPVFFSSMHNAYAKNSSRFADSVPRAGYWLSPV